VNPFNVRNLILGVKFLKRITGLLIGALVEGLKTVEEGLLFFLRINILQHLIYKSGNADFFCAWGIR
jgi:hypothetical protein